MNVLEVDNLTVTFRQSADCACYDEGQEGQRRHHGIGQNMAENDHAV